MHIGNNQIRTLLAFLFAPEDSSKILGEVNGRQVAVDKTAAALDFRETLKSAVWIVLSIFLAMTLAQLN